MDSGCGSNVLDTRDGSCRVSLKYYSLGPVSRGETAGPACLSDDGLYGSLCGLQFECSLFFLNRPNPCMKFDTGPQPTCGELPLYVSKGLYNGGGGYFGGKK